MSNMHRNIQLLLLTLFSTFISYASALRITNLIVPPPSFTTSSNATITWIHDGNDPLLMDIQLLHKSGQVDTIASNVTVSSSYYLAITPFTSLQVGGWGKIQCIRQEDRSVLSTTPRLRVDQGNGIVPFSQAVPVIIQSGATPTSTGAPTGEETVASSNSDDGADSISNTTSTSSVASASVNPGAATLTLSPSPIHTATMVPTHSPFPSSSLSVGARAGIGIGVAGSVSLIGLTAIFLLQHYRRQKNKFRAKKDFGGTSYDPARDMRFRATQGIGVFKAELDVGQREASQVQEPHRSLPPAPSVTSEPTPTNSQAQSPGSPFSSTAAGGIESSHTPMTALNTIIGRLENSETLSSVGVMHGGLGGLHSSETETQSSDGPVELDAATTDLEMQGINEPTEGSLSRSHRYSLHRPH